MKKKLTIGKVLIIEIIIVIVAFTFTTICNMGVSGLGVIGNYIDMPSLIIMVLFVVPVIICSGMGRDFINAFLVGKKPYSMRQLKRALEAVQLTQRMVICGTGIPALMGIICILQQLDVPAVIGVNLAVAILPIFYALVAEIFLATLKANVMNEIADMMEVSDEEA